MTTPPTILGLDPGTRFMGVAVIRGPRLLDYGVHQLRNGERADELLEHAKQVLFAIIRDHGPSIVAIEAPYLITSKRAAVLSTLAQVLHARASALGIDVVELSPENVRKRVAGDPKAKKIVVAKKLGEQFPEISRLIPQQPRVPALWLTARERYWLHMFDALALAVVLHEVVGKTNRSGISGHAGPLE